ncbi:MAG: UbiX family flavin prenyltransferase [Thermoplasmata archaeon]|nr:UbiX family flavin prenyltransferase [Thermoplasmata archaeon]
MTAVRKIVVGVTGASGVAIGLRLLEVLTAEKHLILSEDAKELIHIETDITDEDAQSNADFVYDNSDMSSPLASGSCRYDAMVIAPCSMSTLSKIAVGISDNLMTRAAAVCLKEHRLLILVPRETPLSAIHLRNMADLAQLGVYILPACPAYYPKPESIEDMIDFVVGRVLDVLGIENSLYDRWEGTEE